MKTHPTIHAATAMFPGLCYSDAVERICAGVSEPVYGQASSAEIQLCPQSSGHLGEAACEALAERFAKTKFRLHANAKVQRGHKFFDASTFNDQTRGYYEDLADRSRRLGATAYSLHAGYAENCTLSQMLDNLRRIQDIFGPGIEVAVEGLYPNNHRAQLMDTWAAYEEVMRSGVAMAIDLSHLHIVARKESNRDYGLMKALVQHDRTLELHISDNNGAADSHAVIEREPWWWPVLQHAGANAVVFSESNQVRHSTRYGRATPNREIIDAH